MECTPFFSVIMPAFGVEDYLRDAATSILNQTFKDLELIIVDDCSNDDSGIIAEKLAATDCRVKVIHHKTNLGLSVARNSGMELATGQYFYFMDSDDVVETNLLQEVYNSLSINKADLVVFGLIEEYFDGNGHLKREKKIVPERLLTKDTKTIQDLIIKLEDQTLLGYAWNKLYSAACLKQSGLKFEKITLIEDILFNISFCRNVKSINVLSIAPYHYKKRGENSLTNKFVPDYYSLHRERVQLLYSLYSDWGQLNFQVKQILGRIYMRYIYSALERNCDRRSGMDKNAQKLWCEKLYKEKLFQNLIIESYKPKRFIFQGILYPLKKENTNILLLTGQLLHFVKDRLAIIFWRF